MLRLACEIEWEGLFMMIPNRGLAVLYESSQQGAICKIWGQSCLSSDCYMVWRNKRSVSCKMVFGRLGCWFDNRYRDRTLDLIKCPN